MIRPLSYLMASAFSCVLAAQAPGPGEAALWMICAVCQFGTAYQEAGKR